MEKIHDEELFSKEQYVEALGHTDRLDAEAEKISASCDPTRSLVEGVLKLQRAFLTEKIASM